jgi:hypothetical protein
VVIKGRGRDAGPLGDLAGGNRAPGRVGQQLSRRTQQPRLWRKLAIETNNRYTSTYSNAI